MPTPTRDPLRYYPHDYLMRVTFIPFIPACVTPNHITVARFLLTPFVLWGLATESYLWSIPFFVLVAFTDVLDGSLARVREQVTEWGMLYDPIADKILISLVAVLVVTATVGWWLTVLLIFCELAIVLGAVSRKHQHVMMANAWGKTKMFAQSLGVVLLLLSLALQAPVLVSIGMITLLVAVALAIMSLVTYGV